MNKILIANEVTLGQGVTTEEGKPIGDKIRKCIEAGEKVTLDFRGVQLITTAFLNVVIGTLYKDYTTEQLKPLLGFDNLTDEIAKRIKRVTTNAKQFYNNPDQFQEDVDKAMYGDR